MNFVSSACPPDEPKQSAHMIRHHILGLTGARAATHKDALQVRRPLRRTNQLCRGPFSIESTPHKLSIFTDRFR